MTISNPQRRSR
ncbi:hypothetical protein RDI58_024445 [Solanum bulbocastanum]|uniref:Uncharacterized protein n=1 Tax=Solanum bulbocastanum TaxID=147425 RepID=A0AAN8T1W3_SOLBU